MPTLDTSPLSPTGNAYLSVAEADFYFANNRLHVAEWSAASTDDRGRAIIWATRLLDECIVWDGAIRTTTQKLRFPRSGLVDRDGRNIDYDTYPEFLKNATAELALALVRRERTAEPELLGLGFSEAGVSTLKVKVDPSQLINLIPQHILTQLSQFGTLASEANLGMRQVRIGRS